MENTRKTSFKVCSPCCHLLDPARDRQKGKFMICTTIIMQKDQLSKLVERFCSSIEGHSDYWRSMGENWNGAIIVVFGLVLFLAEGKQVEASLIDLLLLQWLEKCCLELYLLFSFANFSLSSCLFS